MFNWQPWDTVPQDRELTVLVALDLSKYGQGVTYQVFKRHKISNGWLEIIGNHFAHDEEVPFAWTHFSEVDASFLQ